MIDNTMPKPAVPSLGRSLTIQGKVIAALLMREVITRYGRRNLGILWVFVEPMIFTLGVTILWNIFGHSTHGSGLSVTAFAYTGYSTVMLWRNAVATCGKAIWPNKGLLFHRNVKVLDLFYSRVILEIAGGTISTIFIGIALVGWGWIAPPEDLLLMVCAWLLLMCYTFCIGTVVGALSERWDWFDRLYHPAMYFYLGISGAFFLVEWLPESVRPAALWVPTVHITEMLRHGYFGQAVRTHEEPGYLAAVCLCLFFTGLLLAKYTEIKVGEEE